MVAPGYFRLWRLKLSRSEAFSNFSVRGIKYIPYSFSPAVPSPAASRPFFSLPMRYRHKGQLVAGHRRTSALFPPQQSRHLSRIAFPLVILSSMYFSPILCVGFVATLWHISSPSLSRLYRAYKDYFC